MPDYKKMYFELFNAITNVIEILQKAQLHTEAMYISQVPTEMSQEDADNIFPIDNDEY